MDLARLDVAHEVGEDETLCFSGVAGGYSILNVRFAHGEVSLLTGSIPADGHVSGLELLRSFVAEPMRYERLFLAGDATFNESFATATAQAATSKWLTARGDEAARKLYAGSIRCLYRITQMLRITRDNLRTLYSNPPDDINVLRRRKANIYHKFRTELEALRNEPGFSGIKGWLRRPMNNASLGSVAIYHRHVPAFHNLFKSCEHNFPDYFKAVEQLGELPHAERHRVLDMLRLSAP